MPARRPMAATAFIVVMSISFAMAVSFVMSVSVHFALLH
jgi:hypothetical protein